MLQKGSKEDDPTTQSDTADDLSNDKQCDVFLSLEDPKYKSILFEQFKAMEDGRTAGKPFEVASKLFELFKEQNGKFFKWNKYSHQYYEVDENMAGKSEWLALLLLKHLVDTNVSQTFASSHPHRNTGRLWSKDGDLQALGQ